MIAYYGCPTSHNSRQRFRDGFYCEDCGTFFRKDSPTYRSGELLSSIHMVLGNIRADYVRGKEIVPIDITIMMEKIGIGVKHENYEELITEAEIIMEKYNKNSESATVRV